MRLLYSLLFYLCLPFIVLRLLWKKRRQRLAERLMWRRGVLIPVDLWIHAVSLGEVNAALALAETCLSKGWRLLFTTMTPTGSERVQTCLGNRVIHQYIPYDLPWFMRCFFKKYQPRVGIIMETELWPNLLTEGQRAGVRLFSVNARISPSAFRAYQKIRWFLRPYLNKFEKILTQSDPETRRFLALGVMPSRIETVGNLKFDVLNVPSEPAMLRTYRQRLGNDRVIICAASTHANEEALLLAAFQSFQKTLPNALLVLVPRHPERFQTVFELSKQHAYQTVLSRELQDGQNIEVLVVNTIGELMLFYTLSDYAFVGGSLVPVGGHNVLEPIHAEVPVFVGPYMHHFQGICDALLQTQGMQMVSDAEALFRAIAALHREPALRKQQLHNATAVLRAHQGALKRCMHFIEVVVKGHPSIPRPNDLHS